MLGGGDQGGGELAAGQGQEAVDAGAYAGGQVVQPVGRQGGGRPSLGLGAMPWTDVRGADACASALMWGAAAEGGTQAL